MKPSTRSSNGPLGDDAPQEARTAAERRALIEQCAARLAAGGEPTTEELRLLAAERARLLAGANAGHGRGDRRWQRRVEEVERQALFIQRPLPAGALEGLVEEVLARAQVAATGSAAHGNLRGSAAQAERREALSHVFLGAPRTLGLWRAAAAAAVLFAVGVVVWRGGGESRVVVREDARPLLLQPFADAGPEAVSPRGAALSSELMRASSQPHAARGWRGLRVFPLRDLDALRNDAAVSGGGGAMPLPDVREEGVGLERN